jgi:hypothetical protein
VNEADRVRGGELHERHCRTVAFLAHSQEILAAASPFNNGGIRWARSRDTRLGYRALHLYDLLSRDARARHFGFLPDSAAAIVHDDQIVAAALEFQERFVIESNKVDAHTIRAFIGVLRR